MMDDLKDIRREIDAIDDQLIPLLCRRMDCSLRVASYKAAHGLPVLNEEREQQVLEQVRAVCCKEGRADYAEAAALVFASTMDVSRALQHRALGPASLCGRRWKGRLAPCCRRSWPVWFAKAVQVRIPMKRRAGCSP